MTNYVNQEAFFEWYESVSRKKDYNKNELLSEVFEQYVNTGRSRFELPASKTSTGRPEGYDYVFEDLGKCGGSVLFIYF